MALINADELMKWCNNHYDFEVFTVGYFAGIIQDMPTDDVEPVRHGKWLCSDDMYETAVCSVCNCDTEEPYEYVKKSWNFCPNCGAKMDGGTNGSD